MTDRMRALVKTAPGKGLEMQQVDKPEPGPGEVLIRVRQVSICGTDMHIYQWDDWAAATVPVPLLIGHEFVGIIEACGRGVTGFEPGQRVSGEGHIVCKQCRNCRAGREHLCRNTLGVGVNRAGAFADFLVIPEHNVYLIPDSIPDELASILDPFGNAVHTALGFDLAGEDVLITGAGPIGLMAAAICRHVGARHVVVTDLNASRLKLAEKLGASSGIAADLESLKAEMERLGMKEGFDVGLEMSGATAALANMIDTANNGARIGLLGIFAKEQAALALNKIIFKGIRLKGVYGREMFDTWHKGIAMLESGLDIYPVITHQFDFEDFQQGFDVLESGEASKVVLGLV